MTKHILITGSTDGIGKQLAEKLATDGHYVYLHGRSPGKLKAALEQLKTVTDNDKISGLVADFADLKAVKKMAKQVVNSVPKLDVLINNAGVFHSPMQHNQDGLDLRLVVNYLAPYLLTNALLPALKKAQSARIINLSSAAQGKPSIPDLRQNTKTSSYEAYAMSKLALTMWSFALAKELKQISVIAVNPGSLLNTKMVQEAFGEHRSPAAKGVNILYELALSKQYQGISGKYFDNDLGETKGTFGSAHPAAYDPLQIKTLLDETKALLLSYS